jgi:hypothetical protein
LPVTAAEMRAVRSWQVNLVNGYAEVTLTSSTETVITEVTVYDVAGQLGKHAIYIQFA